MKVKIQPVGKFLEKIKLIRKKGEKALGCLKQHKLNIHEEISYNYKFKLKKNNDRNKSEISLGFTRSKRESRGGREINYLS